MSSYTFISKNGRTCPSNLSAVDTAYCISKSHHLTGDDSKWLLVIEVLEVIEIECCPIELMLN